MKNKMIEISEKLNEASAVYEQGKDEIMSNFEYDRLYDELMGLEAETGIVLSGSATQKVGYEIQSKLAKVNHNTKMLSLDKTKDIAGLLELLGDSEGMLSWKEDGLTTVATYDECVESAVTRGNGVVGEDITNNFKVFKNIPLRISTRDRLVLRGEAVISYDTFEKINSNIVEEEEKYKNPRNLCSGSVRQLDPNETRKRDVEFIVFEVIEGFDGVETKSGKLECAREYGFDIVDYKIVTKENLEDAIKEFTKNVGDYAYPVDGLVLTINNIEYSVSLGTTSKFPKDSIAFKWEDELKETELLYIDWSCSRTGAINPVAVFNPVELEGTTVNRASVHNISMIEELELGVGDRIKIMKANMIIPQVGENLTRSGDLEIPNKCPVCGGDTEIVQSNKAKVLYCTNKECIAKHIGELNHFTKRDAMNIEGLSEATLERFIKEGFIKDYKDIYYLEKHRDKIVKLEGFGVKSYDRIIKAVESSREVGLAQFIYSLGVVQMGRTTSGLLCDALENDLETIINVDENTLLSIDGIGKITAKEIVKYFDENAERVRELAKEMKFKKAVDIDTTSPVAGKIFVVTGSVFKFKNRKEVENKIKELGGKTSGSVSSKTDYLINNDITSTSGKNKTAQDIGIPIISEEDFIALIGGIS